MTYASGIMHHQLCCLPARGLFACVSAVFRWARPKGERDQTSPAIVCKKSLLGNDKRVVQRSLVSRE